MEISFHEEAVKSLNSKAELLLSKLSPKPKEILKKDSFKTDTITIPLKINVKGSDLKHIDIKGNCLDCYFEYNNCLIGLDKNNYNDLIRLSEEFLKNSFLKNSVSVKFLNLSIFQWLKEKYTNNLQLNIVDFIIKKSKDTIKLYEIAIPIDMTEVQTSFFLGKVEITEFKKEIFENTINYYIKDNKHNCVKMIEETSLRQEFQGKAIGLIRIEAEPILAKEYAFHELKKSLSLLRFFHDASKHPDFTCYSVPSGSSVISERKHFILRNGIITNYNVDSALIFKPWLISSSDIQSFKSNGLDILHNLINIKRNEFQDKLLNSLLLFSKCSISSDYSEKLTAILVALESLLLKNENEPIQTNISERIAFTISNNKDERIEIVNLIKDIYSLRSKFLHHGKKVDDIEKFKKFMLISWFFFQTLITDKFRKQFQNIDAFFKWIDEKKFT